MITAPHPSSAIPSAVSWELYTGIISLVIIGPGDGWLIVSKPEMRPNHKPGTVIERHIAQAALDILNREHRYTRDNVTEVIRKAWHRAAREMRKPVPQT